MSNPFTDSPALLFEDRAARAKAQWEREFPNLGLEPLDLDPMVMLGRLGEAGPLILTKFLAPAFAALGLKPGEFDVLATLVRSGAPYKLTPTELYRSTMTSSGGMTARLDKLEKYKLIERCAHPEDRRALMVCLTPKALDLIKGMLPDYIKTQHEAVSGLTKEEQLQLSDLLGKLIRSVKEPGE
ncbi:transcriptional regulator, MarR family [Roseibium hamelinense]|uniref:Transcriptional regulator, MarR family n=1 Tax=Roseibium hamelinense TaxID=150831 RepID=A0A562T8H0_9HYPH|nr:MarR family transcriptional regulator [Roseibium hamelinense]MTI42818.1 MarR family transcriptional regulator [Roseibium hamelinense]TWI89484.1 transcriptional regulator, MarR family [Roseibium hamelinense]